MVVLEEVILTHFLEGSMNFLKINTNRFCFCFCFCRVGSAKFFFHCLAKEKCDKEILSWVFPLSLFWWVKSSILITYILRGKCRHTLTRAWILSPAILISAYLLLILSCLSSTCSRQSYFSSLRSKRGILDQAVIILFISSTLSLDFWTRVSRSWTWSLVASMYSHTPANRYGAVIAY